MCSAGVLLDNLLANTTTNTDPSLLFMHLRPKEPSAS